MLRPLGAGVAGGGVGGAILQALFWGLEPAAIGDLHCSGAPLHWGPAFDVPSLCAGILLGLALAQVLDLILIIKHYLFAVIRNRANQWSPAVLVRNRPSA